MPRISQVRPCPHLSDGPGQLAAIDRGFFLVLAEGTVMVFCPDCWTETQGLASEPTRFYEDVLREIGRGLSRGPQWLRGLKEK